MDKIGRNDPCPCGSQKKHKKCCANKTQLQQKTITVATPNKETSIPFEPQPTLQNLFQKTVTPSSSSETISLKEKVSSKTDGQIPKIKFPAPPSQKEEEKP